MEIFEISDIIKSVRENRIRWTAHALNRLIQRDISINGVKKVLIEGEVIEQYEGDYPYPSCLVYGKNENNKVIHVVCGYDGNELWIITAYYPDELTWNSDLKLRRRKK